MFLTSLWELRILPRQTGGSNILTLCVKCFRSSKAFWLMWEFKVPQLNTLDCYFPLLWQKEDLKNYNDMSWKRERERVRLCLNRCWRLQKKQKNSLTSLISKHDLGGFWMETCFLLSRSKSLQKTLLNSLPDYFCLTHLVSTFFGPLTRARQNRKMKQQCQKWEIESKC